MKNSHLFDNGRFSWFSSAWNVKNKKKKKENQRTDIRMYYSLQPWLMHVNFNGPNIVDRYVHVCVCRLNMCPPVYACLNNIQFKVGTEMPHWRTDTGLCGFSPVHRVVEKVGRPLWNYSTPSSGKRHTNLIITTYGWPYIAACLSAAVSQSSYSLLFEPFRLHPPWKVWNNPYCVLWTQWWLVPSGVRPPNKNPARMPSKTPQ